MKLNHLGYATKDLQKSINTFVKMGYETMYDAVKHHEPKNMHIMRVRLGDTIVELMSVADPEKQCFLSDVFTKSTEPFVLHHLCYDVEDIQKRFDELMATGEYTVYEPITSGVFQKNKICFLRHEQIGLIEFFEWPK